MNLDDVPARALAKLQALLYEPDFALGEWRFVRVLLVGFDTLHFTSPLEVSHAQAYQLEQAMHRVRDGEQLVMILDAEPFKLAPGGGRDYRFKFEGETGNILLCQKDAQQTGRGGVKVEIGSFGCWHGPPTLDSERDPCVAAYLHMRRCVNALLWIGDGWPAHPRRADFCTDFQTGGPILGEDTPLGMVTRAKRSVKHKEGKRAHGPAAMCRSCEQRLPLEIDLAAFCPFCSWPRSKPPHPDPARRPKAKWIGDLVECDGRTFYKFRHFTGWQWGMGRSNMLRLYDKTEEIKQQSPDKKWFVLKWKQSGLYREGETVMRLENEAKGPLLDSFKIGGQRLETMEQLFEHATSIYRYIVGHHRRVCRVCWRPGSHPRKRRCDACGAKLFKPKAWAELRLRNRQKVFRWKAHELWKRLQDVTFPMANEPCPDIRRVRDEARAEMLLDNGFGQLTSWCSITGVRGDLYQKLGRSPSADELALALFERAVAEYGADALLARVLRKDELRVEADDDGRLKPKPPRVLKREPFLTGEENVHGETDGRRVERRAAQLTGVTHQQLDAARNARDGAERRRAARAERNRAAIEHADEREADRERERQAARELPRPLGEREPGADDE